ncbi:hypothetical protein HYC85_022530 [Camellia sinensis]|uniref:Uncharacterized protein n=1 Tax=Camellia sinensis TaxID=4442 RepID=A0A7J7GKN6_CAMSI|nr:hypothetical protein HYC85_022530 [Camellia sinensis]
MVYQRSSKRATLRTLITGLAVRVLEALLLIVTRTNFVTPFEDSNKAMEQSMSALTLIWCGHAASMVNRVSCDSKQSDSSVDELTSDTAIEVSIEIPFAFRPIPVQAIESTDTQVLEQILRIMLPCFMAQVCDLDIFPL